MNNIVAKVSFLFIFSITIMCNVCAQLSLPERAMGIPKVFLDEEESWNWAEIAKDRRWGESSNQFWRVYVDREGVKAYESPRSTSRVVKKLSFMNSEDVFYVAQEQNGYVLLYLEKDQQQNLEISDKAKAIGWVSVDELLLWSTCPRTISQIYQKAVILKDPEEIQNKKDLNEVSPEFSKSPHEMISTKRRATDLEFYFVFKMVDGAALLLEDNKITNSLSSTKKGWMKKGLYTLWNDRLCYEPNFGEEVEGATAAIFTYRTDAVRFKSTGNANEFDSLLFNEKLSTKRWSPKKVRFPVIDIDQGSYISRVGTISSLGSSSSPTSPDDNEEWEKLTQKINEIETKLRKTNVVFVMDGTSSMKKYYQPMAKALEQAMQQNEMQGANMHFGAVVYRNYADEKDGRLIETKQLTNNYMSVAQWLVSRECRSIGDSHYEAMLYGLETALEKMNWSKESSNFIILVGDAANELPDSKGKTLDGIAAKLAAKGINLVVFQANHMDHAAYHDFALQTQKLVMKSLSLLTEAKIERGDFYLCNQLYSFPKPCPIHRGTSLYEYNRCDYTDNSSGCTCVSENYKVVSAGFRFAEINKQESEVNLRDLVEIKIVDFKRQAEENLKILKQIIENIPGTSSDIDTPIFGPGAEKYLIDMGLTREEIEVIKNRGLRMKIKGHATRVAGGTEVFTTSVFMAKSELELLIQSLSSVNQEVTENLREDLQDALKNLVLSYMGQNANADDMPVEEIMLTISGLTATIGKRVLPDVNISDITKPSKVTEEELEDFMKDIARDVDRLIKLREDKSCYFESSNGLRYYYILIEDMPLMSN